MALQTLGRCTLALRQMRSAIARSAARVDVERGRRRSKCLITGMRISSVIVRMSSSPPRGMTTSMRSVCWSRARTASRSVVRIDERDRAARQARVGGVAQDRRRWRVGADASRAAAQDDGVAGLEAEAGGVGGDVRARLVDDADRRRAARAPARCSRPFGRVHAVIVSPTGSGSAATSSRPARHRVDARRGERQAVDERRRGRRAASSTSAALAARSRRLARAERGGAGAQRRVLLGGRREGERAARRRAPRGRARSTRCSRRRGVAVDVVHRYAQASDEVVAMDHLVAHLVAEERLDLARVHGP